MKRVPEASLAKAASRSDAAWLYARGWRINRCVRQSFQRGASERTAAIQLATGCESAVQTGIVPVDILSAVEAWSSTKSG
jgi:hypothetical protein